MKVALIGCGAIGEVIAEAIANKKVKAKLEYLLDSNREKAEKLSKLFEEKPKIANSIEDILSSEVELVIEAASIKAARQFLPKILEAKKNAMVMSVGVFADEDFYERMLTLGEEKNVKIFLPSGAIGAIDALSSASMEELYEVTLTTIKNPKSFGLELKERKTLFRGNAIEAIEKFPQNINVAVTLALAGIGIKKTKVEIIADPKVRRNMHRIKVRGSFGEFNFEVKNEVSPKNPKTSYLAALSAIATLKRIVSPIKIG
ncbi:MAG: aspartate dehydrogenase [Candidatus Hydrothermarchaeota archaeon]|nr:MAG: aspartate dehydrogenase [Candidatus Hydrothermarchaeota archaeon]